MRYEIRVLWPDGRFAYTCTPTRAREMVRAGLGRLQGNARRYHTLQLFDGPVRPRAGTYYSHQDETRETNPRGVWALRDIISHPITLYRSVLLECCR